MCRGRRSQLTLPSTAMTSNYTAAPPPYQAPSTTKPSTDGSSTPLLGGERVSGPSSGPGAIYDQPDFDDVPDDFKVCSLHILALSASLMFTFSMEPRCLTVLLRSAMRSCAKFIPFSVRTALVLPVRF